MNTYPLFNCSAAFALLLPLAASLPAVAEELASPVALEVNDITPATGFASDAVTDVLGLRIGMTYSEVETVLEAANLTMMADAEDIPDADQHGRRRMGYLFRTGEVSPTFSWDDGFQMAFEPVRASCGLTMYSEQVNVTGELAEYTNGQYLWVSFGGPSVGSRVQEIRRSHQLEELVDAQVMLDSITAKYGPPSFVKARGDFGIDIAYYYKAGDLVAKDHRRRRVFSGNCKPTITTRGSSDILYSDANISRWYGNWRDPRASRDDCDAALFVRLNFGDLPNTIKAIDVAVMDNVARWENANAIRTQAEPVHAEWLLSVAGSKTAPDL